MEMQSPKLERLLTNKRAGWANIPKTGSIPGVTTPAGTGSILVEKVTGCIILSDEGKPFTRPEKVSFTWAARIDVDRYRQKVDDFEGHVTYMYLDIKGNVTVGLGHLIRNAAEAKQLRFFERGTTNPVHPAHIENAFNKVLNSRLAGSKHTAFKDMTHIDLDLDEIENLFDDDVMQFIHELNHKFTDFETYPASAQLGMLDLAYNMGTTRFAEGFPVFRDALKFRNWLKVAEESHRKEVDEEGNVNEGMQNRNKVVRGWFLDAIKDEPFFVNPDRPPRRLSMIPG